MSEKWLAFSPDPLSSSSTPVECRCIQRRHGHLSPHVPTWSSREEILCADRGCPAGAHIELPLGAAFGTFVAGDEVPLLSRS